MSISITSKRPPSTLRNNTTQESKRRRHSVVLFGHFGAGNFGNEATLQAMLCRLRETDPDIEISCICPQPQLVAITYSIKALANREQIVKPWNSSNPLSRMTRKVFIGIPSECYRWLKGFSALRRVDAFIVPGTGLLSDAYTCFGYGPYDMFRWSLTAKLCKCKLLFVSVGAGPLYSCFGRFFAKASLALADFRSYRDESTRKYLLGVGFQAESDPVYPDLVFSLPQAMLPPRKDNQARRPIVGLGLMQYAGKYSVERPTNAIYSAYLESLAAFVKWLLAREYHVQLLIGDQVDTHVTQEFKSLLERSAAYDTERIVDEPAESVGSLMSQLAATDFVVATRFHNVLLSMLLNKPVIAVSFHHKCSSLMSQMGLAEYCQDINDLTGDKLIDQFCRLEQNAASVKQMLTDKVANCQDALDEQYGIIIRQICPDGQQVTRPAAVARTSREQPSPLAK